MLVIIVLIITLALSLSLTPLMIRLAPVLGALDKPNERKVHQGLMPRLGGLAIYLAFVCGVLLLDKTTDLFAGSSVLIYLLLSCGLVVACGFVDDIINISPKIKLLIQVAAALLFIQGGAYVDFITNPFTGGQISLGFLGIPVTVLWLVGISNAVNLIDGLDGLSAGTSAIAALTMAFVCWTQGNLAIAFLALILAMAILGFLRYNFNPARIFMGDCGSLFLGFALAALAVMGLSKAATTISIFIPFLILGIPVFDTFFAVIRRLSLRRPIMEADKGHLHHQLLALGLNQRQTVLCIYGVNILMGSAAILLAVLTAPQAILVLLLVTVLIFAGADWIGVLRGKRRIRRKASAVDKE